MRAICRQIAKAIPAAFRGSQAGPAGRRILRRIALSVVLAGALVALAPRPGHAKIDAADVAVDAFLQAGKFAGLSIPPEAAGYVKELVGCLARGKAVPDCARESVVKALLKNVPKEAGIDKFASCLTAPGGNFRQCAADVALKQVPEAARPLAQCMIDGGNVAGCAEKFAISQVSGAIDNVTKQATDKAIETLKSLKADAEDAVARELPPSIRDLILVVEGINEAAPEKIIVGGGPIVYKLVVTAILNVMLPVAFRPLIGPMVEYTVDGPVDAVKDILEAAKNGDPVEMGKVVFKYYLNAVTIGPACALVPAELDALKEATCGNLAKLIHALADVGGDVADAVLGLVPCVT